jgi:hypothetical protein
LQRNRTIRHIRLFFFFLEKIDCFVHVEKLRFIEYDVAIIIFVVFLWISDSKDIDEVIIYQIFNECSRFHFSFFLSASVFLRSENALQSNILRWVISFRIDSFSNFCMKINDEFQLNVDDDVRFNMCVTTK